MVMDDLKQMAGNNSNEEGGAGGVATAVARYQQARTDGLCHEGALEVALAGVEDEVVTAVSQQIIKEKADVAGW
jgi:hypothetical protein